MRAARTSSSMGASVQAPAHASRQPAARLRLPRAPTNEVGAARTTPTLHRRYARHRRRRRLQPILYAVDVSPHALEFLHRHVRLRRKRPLRSDWISRRRARVFTSRVTRTLAHEMGRTWRLAAVYQRSAGFSDLVFEPVTSDSVTRVAFRPHRAPQRVLSVKPRRPRARGNRSSNNDFTSYSAHAQWRRAMTRHLAAHVNYLYYNHDFGQSVSAAVGFPHSARIATV